MLFALALLLADAALAAIPGLSRRLRARRLPDALGGRPRGAAHLAAGAALLRRAGAGEPAALRQLAGTVYLLAALVAGAPFFAASAAFKLYRSPQTAKRLMLVSVFYLPAVLTALAADRLL